MPAHDGVRGDKKRRPPVPAQHASEPGDDRTVVGLEAGSWHLTVQDSQLMAQDEDLRVLGAIRAAAQYQQVDHEADKTIEASHSSILAVGRPRHMPTKPRSTRPDRFPAPTGSGHGESLARDLAPRTLQKADGPGRGQAGVLRFLRRASGEQEHQDKSTDTNLG
jgi:hypothetical protein